MWFEILPGAVIIFAAMSVPHMSAYLINRVGAGNAFRRSLYTKEERLQYLRDWELSGNPYKIVGLEAIPDK